MCTPKSFTDDEVYIYIFLIDTDVFCSMILFLFIDDNALIVQDMELFFLLNKNIYNPHVD